MAVFGVVAAADAAVWSPDFNISGGDVNETFTPLNGQRGSSVILSADDGVANQEGDKVYFELIISYSPL